MVIKHLAGTLRSSADLVEAGLVHPDRAESIKAISERYAIAITPLIAGLIDPNDPDDPIGRQFLPDPAELLTAPGERADPIEDSRFQTVKGIVHRYPDRVLLKPLHACPVYCRFCFRRETVGPGGDALSRAELDACFAYVAGTPSISEVIITGGDPLMLSPDRLRFILDGLSAIEHLTVIRIHSRVPIVDPARVRAELVQALDIDKALFIVIHANHPRELTKEAAAACRLLTRSGISLLSQSVLLHGVNDDATTLEALFRGLLTMRVKPYYLHHPDLAPGTAHFRVSIEHGQALMKALRGRLSGLAQPHYVLDLPGGYGKVPIGASYLEKADTPQKWLISDYLGRTHLYPPESDDPVGSF